MWKNTHFSLFVKLVKFFRYLIYAAILALSCMKNGLCGLWLVWILRGQITLSALCTKCRIHPHDMRRIHNPTASKPTRNKATFTKQLKGESKWSLWSLNALNEIKRSVGCPTMLKKSKCSMVIAELPNSHRFSYTFDAKFTLLRNVQEGVNWKYKSSKKEMLFNLYENRRAYPNFPLWVYDIAWIIYFSTNWGTDCLSDAAFSTRESLCNSILMHINCCKRFFSVAKALCRKQFAIWHARCSAAAM